MADDLLPLLIDPPGNGDDSSDSEELSNDEAEQHDQDVAMETEERRTRPQRNDGGDGKHRHITFDKSLPGTHSYLGDDLEDVRGRTVHDEDTVVTLPLLPLPDMVLVPGQVIPLHLFQQRLVAMLRSLAETDKTFGVFTYSIDPDDSTSDLAQIGCTAEIFSMKNETDEATGLSTLRAKARGRQRFQILSMHREITGILMGKVKILPEMFVPRCLADARPPSHGKFCCSPTEQDTVVKTALDRHGNVLKSVNMMINKKVDRFSCAFFTQWPPWVYKMYDLELLREQMVQELCSWNKTLRTVSLPEDATDLSFWVVQNLPLDNKMRRRLLGLNCTVHRLRSEISIMKKCAVLCCISCSAKIAHKEDVFSMSVEGPLGAYVNPGGHVHETLTTYKASNLSLVGRSSTEHSWFPGYAWTIAQCRECSSHMGWKFSATKKNLSPQKFWGLCRSSLAPELHRDRGDDEEMEFL